MSKGRIAVFISVGVLLLVGALIIVWAIGPQLGLGLFVTASLIALLPVPVLVTFFLWLDRFDPPSSWRYPAFAFAWGAFVATAASLLVNTGAGKLPIPLLVAILERLLPFPLPPVQEEYLVPVIVAPVIEEITKALAPLALWWFRRREVKGIADAVMYAGLSATGFAMTENVLYLGGVYISGEQVLGAYGAVSGVVALVVVRMGFTGFIHPLFTALTGIGIGLAARTQPGEGRQVYVLVGLCGGMLMHGLWNYTATVAQEDQSLAPLGYLYFGLTLPLLFGVVTLALWARYAPARTIARMLPDYVRAGWMSPQELASLITLRRRLWARRWAKEVAGEQGLRAMRAYQSAATRLALQREARSRGLAVSHPADQEWILLNELAVCRGVFAGRDSATPEAWWDGERFRILMPDGSEREAVPASTGAMPVPTVPRPGWGLPGNPYRHPAPSGHPAPPGVMPGHSASPDVTPGYLPPPGAVSGQPAPPGAFPGHPSAAPGHWAPPGTSPGYAAPPSHPAPGDPQAPGHPPSQAGPSA